MKRFAVVLTVTALVGVTSSCYAGFLPKIGGLKKSPIKITNNKTDDTKIAIQKENYDLSGMLARQQEMTQLMVGCNDLAIDAWVELHNSTGNDVTALLTAKKAQDANMESSEDAEACSAAIQNAAKDAIDEAKVKENKAIVNEAIAKAKELKVQAENKRTAAAALLPEASAEIAMAAKRSLTDFDFAKQFAPVSKAYNLNKKLLSQSDKNLKLINAHIAKLEKLVAD